MSCGLVAGADGGSDSSALEDRCLQLHSLTLCHMRFTGSFRLRSAGFRHYRSLWPLQRPFDGRRKGCTAQARLVTPRVLESEDEPALTHGPLCDLVI